MLFRVFPCFPLFPASRSGLPTHHFGHKVPKVMLFDEKTPFGHFRLKVVSGAA